MDVSRAYTEAAVSYKSRQDAVDKQIRIGSVAYAMLEKRVAGADGDRILGALYGELAHRTRAVARVPDAAVAVRNAAEESAAFSVAGIHADFEWACRDLLSDALEFWPECWNPSLGDCKPPPPAETPLGKRGWRATIGESLRSDSADEGFLASCYSLLGVKPHGNDMALLPLFDFFRMCRNRTLHQDGTAGSSLSDLSRSRELKDAYGSLAASVRRMTPMLPTLRPQQLIALTPSQAILFLIVARGLFDALAMQVRSRLNTDGYLRMAAHYAYGIAHHPFRAAFDHKFVEASAGRYLRERYRVTGAIRTPLVPGFRRLGLWDSIVSRYNDLSTSVPSGTS
jgi:hypothetical protein